MVKKYFHPKEIIGLEELGFLLVGIAFGWFAGKGASNLLIAIPIAFFVLWIMFYLHRKTIY